MLQIPRRSRKTFVLHTFKSSFGGLLMPIRINTQHLDAAPAFDLPILQPFFYNPVAITHRRFSVDGIVYDVYAAHPASVVTKANSTVVIVKRWGGEFPGAGPTHLWEEDRVDAVVAIKVLVFFRLRLFTHLLHLSLQIFQEAYCTHEICLPASVLQF